MTKSLKSITGFTEEEIKKEITFIKEMISDRRVKDNEKFKILIEKYSLLICISENIIKENFKETKKDIRNWQELYLSESHQGVRNRMCLEVFDCIDGFIEGFERTQGSKH